jgi:hypothetical protein
MGGVPRAPRPAPDGPGNPPRPANSGAWENDFHGLLFQCAYHPAVNIAGSRVYAHEADLTAFAEGAATLGADSVTLTFPHRFKPFTITMRGDRFFADGAVRQTDPN